MNKKDEMFLKIMELCTEYLKEHTDNPKEGCLTSLVLQSGNNDWDITCKFERKEKVEFRSDQAATSNQSTH